MAGVNVSIGADSKKAERELSSFERKTRNIAKSIQKGFQERIGHKLFDGLTSAARAVPGFLNGAIESASSLNEEISKSETIFGNSAAEIRKWAKGADEAMGLSEVAALEASGTIGNMFTAMGMGGEEASNMSMAMVQLASDLGSFNNTSTEDAIQAIGAALRGESEPIRRYGVLLDDATLKAEALAKGLYDGTGTLKPASRALAAYSVILNQTTAAQGDFAKTSDGLANSQKILAAQFENAKTEVGKGLLPAMQSLVDILKNMDFEEIGKDVGSLAKSFVELGSSVRESFVGFRILARIITFDFDGAEKMKQDEINKKLKENAMELTEEGEILLHGTEEQKKALLEKLDLQDKELEKSKNLANQKTAKSKDEIEYIERLFALQAELAENEIKNAEEVAKRKKQLLEEEQEKRKEIAEITRDEFKNLSMREAEALAGLGMDGVLKNARKQELLGMGVSEKDATEISDREDTLRRLDKTQDLLDRLSGISSTSAVSSMQSIGGGGGVAVIDIQKRQADLQQQMVKLLEKIKDQKPMESISDF